ncbi:MAG TPA: tRNA (adenosine(37)-N6)-dimethylallyltransferase MiaA [Bacteroidota bacterium]|nr:tRNA (adenosine(37)-N6)-dimethylallyltransferase MiaA [Bacteroidota bacterium]
MLPKILIITGPTASGKSALALEVASILPAEIISADSRQVYKLLSVGTAKPSPEDLRKVPHHLVDFLSPEQHFSAGDFSALGRKCALDIQSRHKLPIVVGGTGLYIRALVDGLFSGPGRQQEIRDKLETRLATEGSEKLLGELRQVDPESASRMLPSNQRRIIRALEVYYATGKSISSHHREQKSKPLFDPIYVGLDWRREELYRRINARVEAMLTAGFLDEVKGIVSAGYDGSFKSLQTVGYKEALSYLRGELEYDRMVELMKQSTRRFAKRQLTWFRGESRIHWMKMDEETNLKSIAGKVVTLLR